MMEFFLLEESMLKSLNLLYRLNDFYLFLSNCQESVEYTRLMSRGCSQGFVFWNLVFNNLVDRMRQTNIVVTYVEEL